MVGASTLQVPSCHADTVENLQQSASLMAGNHPNKEIREALEFAEAHDWRVEKSKGGHSKNWGTMKCPHPDLCWFTINSTPRNPQAEANRLRRNVIRCEVRNK